MDGFRRRELLAAMGAGALAGCSQLPGFGDGEDAPTTPVPDDRARALAERFAPTLYFDADETWYPTDPRPYATERDGRTVVPGFDAVDGYLARLKDGGAPPDPTVFYQARTYEGSSLAVVQFWTYAVFDQFTTNFHWHDWEVLHVFVDTDTGEPQLYVASAHARQVPNNEFLDPGERPRLLAELGSHSTAVSINELVESFERLDLEDTFADVTNAGVDAVEELVGVAVAYGLPRDEGVGLPYVVPELDGRPLYEHPRLPNFERSDLAPPEATIRSFEELANPPADLPSRESGLAFGFDGDADVTYDLVPSADLEHIRVFGGRQLSFEFAVPGFVEDALADHLTVSGAPWKGERYRNPASDITDPVHRSVLADRYDAIDGSGALTQLAGVVRRTVSADEAPEGEGVTTTAPTVESLALVESEPAVVPTFGGGMLVARDLPPGEHRLTVNGAGLAPYSERVRADGTTAVGAGGEVAVVANADAVKLRVDVDVVDETLATFGVEDDFGGRLYETRLDGPDAVYVHRGGAYTAEVWDEEDTPGAFRVNPDPAVDGPVTIERPRTGKAPLADFLSDVAAETRDQVADAAGGDGGSGNGSRARGLVRSLEAVREAAAKARERAEAGDAPGADRRLRVVLDRLQRVGVELQSADLPEPVARAVARRAVQARRRADQALAAEE